MQPSTSTPIFNLGLFTQLNALLTSSSEYFVLSKGGVMRLEGDNSIVSFNTLHNIWYCMTWLGYLRSDRLHFGLVP